MAQQVNAAVHLWGELESFDPNGLSSFTQWTQRFIIWCNANDIPPEPTDEDGAFLAEPNRRRCLFLTMLGPRAFQVVSSAALPDEPDSVSVDMLITVLKEHYEPVGHRETNRFNFQQRHQHPNESVFEFISAIQELAVNCDWGQFYDEALKGRLVCGIRHDDTRRKLLMTDNLTFLRAKEIAIQDDALRNQIRLAELHIQAQAARVYSVNSSSSKPPFKQSSWPATSQKQKQNQAQGETNNNTNQANSKQPSSSSRKSESQRKTRSCHRCGREHELNKCPVISWKCFHCQKIGHIAHMCHTRQREVHALQATTTDGGDVDTLVDHLLQYV